MDIDFKDSIILLMQHPIMRKPLESLSTSECDEAYELLRILIDKSVEEEYTLLDNIQMARLRFNQGELALASDIDDREAIIRHYKSAFHCLIEGGFDLSLQKWVQLVSLRSLEE